MPRRISPALEGIARRHSPIQAAFKGTTATSGYDYNPHDGVASTLKAFRTCNRTDSWPKSFSTKSASCPAAFLRMRLPQPTGNNLRSRAYNSGVLLPRHHLPAPTALSFSSHFDLNRASSLRGVAAQINLQTRRSFPPELHYQTRTAA